MEGKVWGGFLCLAGQSAQRCAHKAWLLPEEKVCLEAAGQASVQLWTRLLGQGICRVSNLSRLWLLQTWQAVDYLTPRRHPGPCAALVSVRARASNNFMAVKSARPSYGNWLLSENSGQRRLCVHFTTTLISGLHHSCTSCNFH